jgi:hypothetical protein
MSEVFSQHIRSFRNIDELLKPNPMRGRLPNLFRMGEKNLEQIINADLREYLANKSDSGIGDIRSLVDRIRNTSGWTLEFQKSFNRAFNNCLKPYEENERLKTTIESIKKILPIDESIVEKRVDHNPFAKAMTTGLYKKLFGTANEGEEKYDPFTSEELLSPIGVAKLPFSDIANRTEGYSFLDDSLLISDEALNNLNSKINFRASSFPTTVTNIAKHFYETIDETTPVTNVNDIVALFLYKVWVYLAQNRNSIERCVITGIEPKIYTSYSGSGNGYDCKTGPNDNLKIFVYLVQNTLYCFFKIVKLKHPSFFLPDNREKYIGQIYEVIVVLFQSIIGHNYIGTDICTITEPFIVTMNELFQSEGADFLFKQTSGSGYTCGRGILTLKCSKTDNNFIAIHKTVSEEDMNVEQESLLTEPVCGGKKIHHLTKKSKLRKHKKTIKKRKSSSNKRKTRK